MTVPGWFESAVQSERARHTIDVENCVIHFDHFPSRVKGSPVLLFVHGNGAHSHWWDFIAPAFTSEFNPVAMDMSGAGDSGHRDQYSALTFANEIIEVCSAARAASGADKCYLVGHSFGGSMSRIAAWRFGAELAGLVLVDSGISAHRGSREPPRPPRTGVRYYESLEQGKRRFRLRPPQPCENEYILDYIAGHSLAEGPAGFHFKLDQALFSRMNMDRNVELPDAVTMIREIMESKCAVGFIYGELSRFFPKENVHLLEELIDPDLLVSIPEAHHHLFLDQPLAFIDAMTGLLAKLEQ